MSQSSTARRTVVWLTLVFSSLAIMPSVVRAQTTALFLDSQAGDPIGGGLRRTYTAPEVPIAAFNNGTNGLSFFLFVGADAGGGPHVRIITAAASGAVMELTSFFAYDPAFSGGVRVGTADLDGDGRAEIIAGAGIGGGPHVMAVRRTDDGRLTPVASFLAYTPVFTGGIFVAGVTR